MLDKTACSATYRGGEDQWVFPIPFPFLENSHISASAADDAGRVAELVPGVDYMLNRVSDENGELVLLDNALPATSLLTIRRRVPLTQDIMFHNQGPNSPQAIEEAVDKLTMIAQQLREEFAGAAIGGAAASGHVHALADIDGLPAALAAAPGVVPGEIRLLPFRAGSLPDGWHCCNGDAWPLASAVGAALAALPEEMRGDWGIVGSEGHVSLPNLAGTAMNGVPAFFAGMTPAIYLGV